MPENTTIKTCANCGYRPFDSDFCPNCGQRKLTEKDNSISSLAIDFLEGIFNLENSFLRTVKVFFSKPASYATSYELGARKKYISPIKLFFFANAFYFLFPAINAFTTTLDIQLNQLIYSGLTRGFIEGWIESSGMGFSDFENQYNKLTATLSKVLLILLPIFFGMATWALSFTSKNRKPFLFHLNRSLLFHAFILLFVVSFVPGSLYLLAKTLGFDWLLSLLNNFSITLISIVLMNAFAYMLYKGFFDQSFGLNLTRTFLLNGVYFLLIFLYRFILLLVTLAWIAAFR